jgi:hypothetical protein
VHICMLRCNGVALQVERTRVSNRQEEGQEARARQSETRQHMRSINRPPRPKAAASHLRIDIRFVTSHFLSFSPSLAITGCFPSKNEPHTVLD